MPGRATPPRALGFHQRERAGPSRRRCCRPKREVQSAGHLGGPGAGILPEHDVAAQLSRELPPPPTQGNSRSTGEALSAASEVTRCCTRGRPCGETRRECRAWWGPSLRRPKGRRHEGDGPADDENDGRVHERMMRRNRGEYRVGRCGVGGRVGSVRIGGGGS